MWLYLFYPFPTSNSYWLGFEFDYVKMLTNVWQVEVDNYRDDNEQIPFLTEARLLILN